MNRIKLRVLTHISPKPHLNGPAPAQSPWQATCTSAHRHNHIVFCSDSEKKRERIKRRRRPVWYRRRSRPGFTIPLGNRRKPGFFPVPGTGRDWKPPGFPGKFRPNLNFFKKFVWTVTAASRAGTVVSRPVSVDFYREMPSAEGKIKNFGNISP